MGAASSMLMPLPQGTMSKLISGAAPALSKPMRKVTVLTVDHRAGDEASVLSESEHIFGLAPDYPTILPMSFDGSKIADVAWAANAVGYTPPGVRVSAAMLQDARATWVSIPDSVFKTAAFETLDAGKFDFRAIPTTEDLVMRKIILTMRAMSNTLDPADLAQIADPIATALAIRTLQQLGAVHGRDAPYPGGLPQKRLRMVLDYIEANLSKQISLGELAGVAMLSNFHFSRAFKQSTNVAPIRYVWQRRVERARDALRRTSAPLVMIAYDCGFSSQSHFATSFKQFTGVTPSAFRASAQGMAASAAELAGPILSLV